MHIIKRLLCFEKKSWKIKEGKKIIWNEENKGKLNGRISLKENKNKFFFNKKKKENWKTDHMPIEIFRVNN